MSWRFDEVWLDTDVLWFREQPQPSGAAAVALPPGATDLLDTLFPPVRTGLDESRRRRLAAQAARRRRLATRTVPARLCWRTLFSASWRTRRRAIRCESVIASNAPSRVTDVSIPVRRSSVASSRSTAAGNGSWRSATA